MVGEIYVQLQQWPLAEHSLVSALAAAPHHAGTHVTLAQILARNVSTIKNYNIKVLRTVYIFKSFLLYVH